MNFVTPHITKHRQQESNLAAPYTEEDIQHFLEKT
jgi:hypothetical protein